MSINILRKQNPLEFVFQDISTFDAENSSIGLLLQELDLGKKDTASHLIKKKAPKLPGNDFIIQNRLNKLRNGGNNNNNDGLLPPPSAPLFNFSKHHHYHPPLPSFNNFIPAPSPLPPPPLFSNFILPPPPSPTTLKSFNRYLFHKQ